MTRSIVRSVVRGLVKSAARGAPYEFITNGGFATDTDWTKGAGWTIAAGIASNSGTGNGLLQDFDVLRGTLTSGRDYVFSFTLSNPNGGLVIVNLNGIVFPGTTQTLYSASTNPGLVSVPFTADANRSRITVFSADSEPISVDNISILGPAP